jgi:hypothetical protein
MTISTVREFRDKATGLLRSRMPIWSLGSDAWLEFSSRDDMLSSDVARQLKRRKVSEDEVLEDFEASRKRRRAARRRR